ncbi:hypothetical protein [Salinispora arenicola]|nr:hypothetical protein [Salinispora arenicola]
MGASHVGAATASGCSPHIVSVITTDKPAASHTDRRVRPPKR